jgi:hypothetical protein
MKTFLFSAIMILVFSFSSIAQNTDTTLVIKFSKEVHDYGTIVQGASGACEFEFTNSGKTPLILNNVSASCGCTIPSWTRDPIQPGKKGVISVNYNTQIIGPFAKTVTVFSNAKNSQVFLTIKGTVNQKAQ